MSGSKTNTCLASACEPNTAAMALLGVAGHALAQRDAHVVHAAARRRRVHRERLAHRRHQRRPGGRLGLHGGELRGVGIRERAAADGQRLEQRVLAVRDRGDVQHRIALHHAVIADIFAERPFGLDMAGGIQKALDDVFGIGRHIDVAGDAFHHRHRLAAQRADHRRVRRPTAAPPWRRENRPDASRPRRRPAPARCARRLPDRWRACRSARSDRRRPGAGRAA